MACSTKVLKIFAIFWDFIYAILSLGLIGISIYIFIKFDHFNTAAFIIFGVGIGLFVFSLFGALGALRESSGMSKTFVGILIILAILQCLVVGFLWAFKTQMLINVNKTFDELWREQPVPIKPGNSSEIASLERWLDCCGNTGSVDYILPPHSCYDSETDRLNEQGCRQKFLNFISERWNIFNIFAIVLVVVELICASFAYVLANSIVNRWRRSKYYHK